MQKRKMQYAVIWSRSWQQDTDEDSLFAMTVDLSEDPPFDDDELDLSPFEVGRVAVWS